MSSLSFLFFWRKNMKKYDAPICEYADEYLVRTGHTLEELYRLQKTILELTSNYTLKELFGLFRLFSPLDETTLNGLYMDCIKSPRLLDPPRTQIKRDGNIYDDELEKLRDYEPKEIGVLLMMVINNRINGWPDASHAHMRRVIIGSSMPEHGHWWSKNSIKMLISKNITNRYVPPLSEEEYRRRTGDGSAESSA